MAFWSCTKHWKRRHEAWVRNHISSDRFPRHQSNESIPRNYLEEQCKASWAIILAKRKYEADRHFAHMDRANFQSVGGDWNKQKAYLVPQNTKAPRWNPCLGLTCYSSQHYTDQ